MGMGRDVCNPFIYEASIAFPIKFPLTAQMVYKLLQLRSNYDPLHREEFKR